MAEKIDWQFDYSCMRYNMDSDDVDAALEAAGLDRNCTVEQAKQAVRQYATEQHFNQQPLPPWI